VDILFVHQNFPGQFRFLAPELVRLGHSVTALKRGHGSAETWEGVRVIKYQITSSPSAETHPWLTDFESKVIRAESCLWVAQNLASNGFKPNVVISHHGWGESLFLKEIWPNARFGIYCEYYYNTSHSDLDFDPEFRYNEIDQICRLKLKNLTHILHFDIANAGVSPTYFQANTFPTVFRRNISVIHEGIDSRALVPNSSVSLKFSNAINLDKSNEVITFVNRNLEPYRGYHIFMRTLPQILRFRPNAYVLIVGGDGVSYGPGPNDAKSWKDKFIREARPQISDSDWSRVLFLGRIPYYLYLHVLQLSTVHVYLTYPFVLSWSMLEAMSIGCTVVGSKTAPVEEVITHGENGLLVNFFDHEELASSVCELLDNPSKRKRLGDAARQTIIDRYDLKTVCLPAQLEWIRNLADCS